MRFMVKEHAYKDTLSIVDYFLNCSGEDYDRMGVDPGRIPQRDEWIDSIEQNRVLSTDKKSVYYVIWMNDDQPIGHCNINKIKFGEEAYMHLHIWMEEFRKKGIASELLKHSIKDFFEHFRLKRLCCEPAANNPAPNEALRKLNFTLVDTYDTVPGWINNYQTVNRWLLTREDFGRHYSRTNNNW
jgi:RimJ/RimL family protein N-acetyltransferase